MTEVRNAFRWLVGATVLLFVVVAVLAVGGYVSLHREIQRNEQAREALCFQRADIDQRIQDTRDILKRFPRTHLIFGIPRALIVSGLKRDTTTRHNLNILDC